jgi:hypothetical protein
MVLITLINGKKSSTDILVLLHAYGEPLTFAQWLYLGKCYLDSEASYYPIEQGFIGKAMLMNAFNEISQGVPFDTVLKHYKLNKKGLIIKDKRKNRGAKVKKSPKINYFRKLTTRRGYNAK